MSGGRDDSGRGGDPRDEAFASRWSRLKRRAKTPPAEDAEKTDPERAAPAATDERSDAEILEEMGLPDPDTLKAGDDFKAFMASAVPARIRNRALRRLWTSNPVLANLDRLVDYDDDFTNAAMVPEVLSTGYKVGRGWLEDAPEKDDAAVASEGAAEPGPAEQPAQAELREAPVDEGESEASAPEEAPVADSEAEPPAQPAVSGKARRETGGAPRPRRMQFRFTDT